MDNNLHFTKKDFSIDWYSGSGAGGQHRNKHRNCCRITHIESGLRAHGTENRSRKANQRTAFLTLAKRVVNHYAKKTNIVVNDDVIRNYNEHRNEVLDKASGLKFPYADVVFGDRMGDMIAARLKAKIQEDTEINGLR